MQGFGRILLSSAAAVVLVSGATVLSTTNASAQFNIEGIIRGAMAHGYYGGGRSYHHHGSSGRVHETRHERHRSREAKEERSKEDHPSDQAKQGSQGGTKTIEVETKATQVETKGPATAPASNAGGVQPAINTTPKQPVADVPALTPER